MHVQVEAQDQNGKALGSFVWFYMGPHVFSYTFSMRQDDPEHKHKIRHSSHLSNQRCPTGHRGGNCLWMVKFLLLLRMEVPLCLCRQAAMACTHCFELDDLCRPAFAHIEMQLLVGWGSAILQLLFDLLFNNFVPASESKIKNKWYVGRKVCFFHFLCLFALRFNWFLNDVPFPDCCTLKPFDAGAAHWHVLIQQKCVPISGLMLEEAHVPFATR